MFKTLSVRLKQMAEGVAAFLLAVIFLAFMAQIVLRYVFNWPVGWTSDVSSLAWLWLVLWGSSFVLRDDEEIRLDFLGQFAGRRGRLAMGLVGSAAIIGLFALSLPAAYSYVTFMKVEKNSSLKVGFDVLYSIYLVFAVAVIGRHLMSLVRCLQGKDPGQADPLKSSSAL